MIGSRRLTGCHDGLAGWLDLRAKGVLWLADEPARKVIRQSVGKRWALEPVESWDNEQPRSRLVVIGLAGHHDEPAVRSGVERWADPAL